MCLQPAPEDAECLWRSDTGWQTVPDVWSSDKEWPVTNWLCRVRIWLGLQSRGNPSHTPVTIIILWDYGRVGFWITVRLNYMGLFGPGTGMCYTECHSCLQVSWHISTSKNVSQCSSLPGGRTWGLSKVQGTALLGVRMTLSAIFIAKFWINFAVLSMHYNKQTTTLI